MRTARATANTTLVGSEIERNLALIEYEAKTCPCGGSKQGYQSFCTRCCHALPPALRAGLSLSIKSGYVEAWKAAKAYLVRIGRVKEVAC